MTFPRIFIAVAIVLFGAIGFAAFMKKDKSIPKGANQHSVQQPIEIDLNSLPKAQPLKDVIPIVESALPTQEPAVENMQQGNFNQSSDGDSQANHTSAAPMPSAKSNEFIINDPNDPTLPSGDIVDLLFRKGSPLPIVETVSYKSRVPWKKGRAAWLVDYSSHYKTPLHFIFRSINGTKDYTAKTINDGQQFNVLSLDTDFYFYMLIDLSRCKMWLYYVMPKKNERVLLKTYRVGLGRLDDSRASGSLTPLGKYQLGTRVAIFQPKMMGNHKGKRVELVRVFGSRWIPFEKSLANCTEPAKGYGIHGTPWCYSDSEQKLVDNTSSVGNYESDGCVRLATQDIEELYSIISTRPGTVEIVKDYFSANMPGIEKSVSASE